MSAGSWIASRGRRGYGHTENLGVGRHLGVGGVKVGREARVGFDTSSRKGGYRETGCAGPDGAREEGLERQFDGGSAVEGKKTGEFSRREGEEAEAARSKRGKLEKIYRVEIGARPSRYLWGEGQFEWSWVGSSSEKGFVRRLWGQGCAE